VAWQRLELVISPMTAVLCHICATFIVLNGQSKEQDETKLPFKLLQ